VSKLIAHDCDASHSMIDSTRNPLNRTLAKRHAERGSTLVEFSLVILPLIGFLFLTLDVAWIFFGWACIQEAAREGVRYAVTGSGQAESTLDTSILNNAVIPFSFGFVNAQNAPSVNTTSSVVSIDYYPSSGYSSSGTPAALDGQANATAAGSVVKVTIHGVSIGSFGPILRSAAPTILSASAADVMQ
jgi:Flp pilus assembly protein TadG